MSVDLPKTQKDKLALMRKIIDANETYELFGKEHLEISSRLCGVNFIEIVKLPCPGYPNNTRHIEVKTDCGIDGAFSWTKAIKGIGGRDKERYDNAMRRAVVGQLRDFFESIDEKEKVCRHCNANTDLTVDHKTTPFSKIKIDFLSSHEVEIGELPNTVGWYLVPKENEEKWKEYHKKVADYQLLCRSCNASKGSS